MATDECSWEVQQPQSWEHIAGLREEIASSFDIAYIPGKACRHSDTGAALRSKAEHCRECNFGTWGSCQGDTAACTEAVAAAVAEVVAASF